MLNILNVFTINEYTFYLILTMTFLYSSVCFTDELTEALEA